LSTFGQATNVHESARGILHAANSYDAGGFVYGVNDRVCQITIRKIIDETNTDFFKIGLANPRARNCRKVGGNCENCSIWLETKYKPSPADLLSGWTAGVSEVSRFSCMKFLGVPGVFDYAGPNRNSR